MMYKNKKTRDKMLLIPQDVVGKQVCQLKG